MKIYDNRPPLIKNLANAREKFESHPRFRNELEGARVLLSFFAKNQFLTSEQAMFAEKLVKISLSIRS